MRMTGGKSFPRAFEQKPKKRLQHLTRWLDDEKLRLDDCCDDILLGTRCCDMNNFLSSPAFLWHRHCSYTVHRDAHGHPWPSMAAAFEASTLGIVHCPGDRRQIPWTKSRCWARRPCWPLKGWRRWRSKVRCGKLQGCGRKTGLSCQS